MKELREARLFSLSIDKGPNAFGGTIKVGRGMSMSRQDRARSLVHEYIVERFDKSDPHYDFTVEDVYVVWFSKTLQNWKALVSTTLPDGMYYEVTHDGNQQRTYIDAYKKFDNVAVPD